MDLLKKYLLANIACFAPRGRVADALQDDEPYEPDATGDDADDVEALEAGDEDPVEDDELAEEEEPEPEPERRPRSRGQARIESTANANRELREQLAASEARLAALEARQNQPAPVPQRSQEEENARLALMSPEERMNYRLENALAANNNQTQQVLTSIQDRTDAADFRVMLRDKPQYKKFEAEVNKRVAELRAKGTPLPREAVLMFVVGEAAVKSTEKPRTKAQSQQRMREQETRPAGGRGDVRGDRRQAATSGSALERRLSNVRI